MSAQHERVAVRPARTEDAEAVAALFNAINSLGRDAPPVTMTAEAVRRDLLAPTPWAVLRVATLDSAVAGFVTASPTYDSERAAGCFMVVDLYVAPEARRYGLGRALMAAMAAEAQRRGAGCLWWGVDDGDDEAFAFYRAIGAEAAEHFTGMILIDRAFAALADAA
ncbi:GNAT family N-acetyltransferase [Elioraea sp.]|uniref:GNAT family N-acetyltransferase n=1 Tax=Elioraea sp. TaxID=2185103 RepID=UPI003F703BF5